MIQGSEFIQVSSNTDHEKVAQGEASLRVDCSGYGMLASRAFSTSLLESKDHITLLLRMPERLGNPWWTGAIDLFVNIPSANQFRQPLGHIDLNGKPLGKWSTLSFSIPAYLKTLFSEAHDDVYFEIALNTAAGTESIYLDGIGGMDSRYTVRIEENDEGDATVLYWDNSATQAEFQYSLNDGAVTTIAMSELEDFDRFDVTIHDLVPGNKITWQVRFQNEEIWKETGWSTYTVLGEHKYVTAGNEMRQVGPYNASKPIVLKPEWSTRYATLITRHALSNAEQASVESMGVNILGISHSANHGYYTISYSGNVNTLAQSLQTNIPAFFNIAPMTKAKSVHRAKNPTTAEGEPLAVTAFCYPDVNPDQCLSIIRSYAEPGTLLNGGPQQGVQFLISEFSLDLLMLQEPIQYIYEENKAFPTSQASPTWNAVRTPSRVEELQDRLGPTVFAKANPIDQNWLKGFPYTGEDIEVSVYDTGINSSLPDFQEGGVVRSFSVGNTWITTGEALGNSLNILNYLSNWLETNQNNSSIDGEMYRNHGNTVAGIILGNGARSNNPNDPNNYSYRGIAPKAKVHSRLKSSDQFQLIAGHVSNHSHTGTGIFYSVSAKSTDDVLHNTGFWDKKNKAIVVSISNNGTQKADEEGNLVFDSATGDPVGNQGPYMGWYSASWGEKNPIQVGAMSTDGIRAEYSSKGPTPDGRIKPDVMAVGGRWQLPNNDEMIVVNGLNRVTYPYYPEVGATSAATPIVSGIAALMAQKYRNDVVGCAPSIPCPEFNGMRNSSVKSILIQTAHDMTLTKAEAQTRPMVFRDPDQSITEKRDSYTFFGAGPDFATGWGYVDAVKAVDLVNPDNFREVEITEGNSKTFYFDVPSNPTSDLNITIAWDDIGTDCPMDQLYSPIPVDMAQSHCQLKPLLINDIDLYLEAPNGKKFYPWKLKPFLGPQSWAKTPYNPNVGIDYIPEGRVDENKAYRDCRKFRTVPSDVYSVENCFDHINNVEKVTVYNAELIDLDIVGFNRMSGRWKAVVNGHVVKGEQIVSVSSDYPITTSSDYITNLWVDSRYRGGVGCYQNFFPISGNLNADASGTSSLNLCATRYAGSIPIIAPEGAQPITSILVSDQYSAPTLYSPVPNQPSLENTISFKTPPYSLDLSQNGAPPIYIYTSNEPALGAPVNDVKTVQASPTSIEADTGGWIRIPQEIYRNVNG